MASSHVDGSVKVYKFNSFEDLNNKHVDCRPDIQFKDHLFAANQVTFPNNNIEGGHQPWLLSCSDDTLIHMYDL